MIKKIIMIIIIIIIIIIIMIIIIIIIICKVKMLGRSGPGSCYKAGKFNSI